MKRRNNDSRSEATNEGYALELVIIPLLFVLLFLAFINLAISH